MRKSRKNIFFLIIIAVLISFQFFPLLGLGEINTNNFLTDQLNVTKLDYSNFVLPNEVDLSLSESESLSDNIKSVFDDNLRSSLLNLEGPSQGDQNYMKVIIHFEEGINKPKRIEIINSLFEDYKIISNYDIISGTYITISPAELLIKQDILEGIKEIKKIYKSEVFENPYIIDDSLQLNALNKDYYSNWWLTAVGAESLPYNGSGVKVAVIDTGIYDHPALNIIENQNFVTDENASDYNDDVGHGTHVAGIIGGDGTGSDGKYRGIAPGVSLINARAGNASGLEEGDIINAIDWSSKPTGLGGAGADIVSMSFGGGYPYISDLITDAISNAQDAYGVIFVASAGNDGPDYFTGSTPASGIDVISVGASDSNDELASFSSWGPTFGYLGYPDVVAPGVNIISAEAKDSSISKEERLIGNFFDFSGDADYIPLSGTSMAAPVVSGALAILKEAYPNITPETARIALLEGSGRLLSQIDDDILKSGAGLINITASLNYLNNISPNYNDTAKVFPDNLPVKPYDLIRFPGDRQKFNLTIISGRAHTYDIEIPNNTLGIFIKLDKASIIFSESGTGFIALDIEVDKDAIPGVRDIQLNLTNGGQIYDTVDIHLDIRLPEYRMLMESFHGLNDWFPVISFDQIGFYEVMSDIYDLNISIDYGMQYWTPDYNKNTDNSILTEERLAQYDLILLQTPVLPYSPLEVINLKSYFDNGGNLLFFGTRYQDMVLDNVNHLFAQLGIDIQINEENIMNDNWLGIITTVSSQSITDFNNLSIFNNVDKFQWLYGNSFTVSNNAESIASKDGKTVVAMYNGTQQGKGNFLAFGDFHWAYNRYSSLSYSQDHFNLLKNSINFLLPEEDVSININLGSERTSNSLINLSIFIKDQVSETPLTSYDTLDITVENETFKEIIIINETLSNNGIYFNNSYNLPTTSYIPYNFTVNLTIGSNSYIKSSKVLFYDNTKVPIIASLSSSETSITRNIGESVNLIASLDKSTYGSIDAFLSIYSYSFFNSEKSVNKTLSLSHISSNNYRNTFFPQPNDPSGYAIFYVIPSNGNYTNPNSPRHSFQIINNPPEILDASSFFNSGSNVDVAFEDTETDDGSLVYTATQGSVFNFFIDVEDSVNYEDSKSNMRVFINIFMASVNDDGFLIFIFPRTIEVAELSYQVLSERYEGFFVIPNSFEYSTLEGTKTVTTAPGFDFVTNQGYLGILYITVYDSEGGWDDFIIILDINAKPIDISFNIFVIIAIVASIGIMSILIYFIRRKKRPRITLTQPEYRDYYYQPSYDGEQEYLTPEPLDPSGPSIYCPFCGFYLKTPRKFCPSCGESLTFNQEE
ncbi:MAG: S8 family serine peptidase [Candidatus Lokiarchaeota archaeon]|nr:S8 family serine peptidase [Candidatus Lokiarchaeota archaeon]